MGRLKSIIVRERMGNEERERFCSGCNEWWPATRDFFYRAGGPESGLAYQCKACYLEKKYAKKRQQKVMMAA